MLSSNITSADDRIYSMSPGISLGQPVPFALCPPGYPKAKTIPYHSILALIPVKFLPTQETSTKPHGFLSFLVTTTVGEREMPASTDCSGARVTDKQTRRLHKKKNCQSIFAQHLHQRTQLQLTPRSTSLSSTSSSSETESISHSIATRGHDVTEKPGAKRTELGEQHLKQ